MSSTLVVFGHGPGISTAVARRFGAGGHRIALVARSADRLAAAVQELRSEGITAHAFPWDLSDPGSMGALLDQIRGEVGTIGALHWNVYRGTRADLTGVSPDEFRAVMDTSVTSLVAAVQAALPDLESNQGMVLVTGGGFAFYDQGVNRFAVSVGSSVLAVAKAAQHKTVGLLHELLAPKGVYVGQVTVTAVVKGTAFDQGWGTLEASTVAERFWQLAQERREIQVNLG